MSAVTFAPPLALDAPAAPIDGLVFAIERPQDAAAADDLIERAFGPGRYAKAAERLREGNHLHAALSVCAWDGERLVGVARQWPVRVGDTPALCLGPFAVDASWRSRGLGSALIRQAGALADAAGERLTVLVGDLSFFAPLGYQIAPLTVEMPGPVDPARVLWRPGRPGALDGVTGPVRTPPAS